MTAATTDTVDRLEGDGGPIRPDRDGDRSVERLVWAPTVEGRRRRIGIGDGIVLLDPPAGRELLRRLSTATRWPDTAAELSTGAWPGDSGQDRA